MPTFNLTTASPKPDKVPRCRKPGHRMRHVPGCTDCCAWSAYDRRLRLWEAANGITRTPVPAAAVRPHLETLLATGTMQIRDIADESGVSAKTIRSILRGETRGVLRINAESLAAVQPREHARPPKAGMVPPLEGVRILRGLAAQGWTFGHMSDLLGGGRRGQAQQLAGCHSEWMLASTIARIRAVAAELGPYDIRAGHRLPGMDMRSANSADRRGWPALWRWQGRDLADPAAEPLPLDPVDPPSECADADGYVSVDPTLVRRIRRAAETVQLTAADDAAHEIAGYIRPFARLTRLEAHLTWLLGEEAGLNDSHIGLLLGYPITSSRQRETAARQVNRMRVNVQTALGWADRHRHGETPDWAQGNPHRRKRDMAKALTPLMTILPEPLGRGWTVAQLAEHSGISIDAMHAILADASHTGGKIWQPQVCKQRRRRRPSARCAAPARTRAA